MDRIPDEEPLRPVASDRKPMVTDFVSKPAAPSGIPGTQAVPAPSRRAPNRRRRAALWSAVLAILVAGMAGWNAWWYWRDTQPLANLKTISDWLKHKQYDQAEPALRERLRRSPHDGEARITLARVLAARGDLAGCARQLHEVPSWWPKKAEALYREGSVYLMLDRAKDAESAWLAVVKDDPLHPVSPDIFHDAGLELLKLYATEDRWEDAGLVLWRAYDEATPDDRVTLLTWRLRSELERVAPLESIPRLQRYVTAAPDDWEALRALARAEQAVGRSDEAERHFQALLKGRPEDPRAWRDYLAMIHERGDRAAFSATIARVPKGAESEPEIWKFRGMAREQAGDLIGAAEDYRQAIERNPNVIEYHYRLALAEGRLNHSEQAALHRERAQRLREARAQLPKLYGDFLDAQAGRKTGGPDLATSMGNLASACETLGFVRAAEAWSQLAKSL